MTARSANWACSGLTDIPDQGLTPGKMSMMENMAKKKPRPRPSFTREFRAEIVELCRRGDRSISEVARDFDLTETSVRQWARQADFEAVIAA
ncbi:hypothetical protein DP939_42915 [Spongiactinospora rosea]|uniref:Transposase IS204/IS1001/IS1096/IS1165 helix-turn-helix domain-containing protein n=2 Tax=Spongiactinospora rosea TaxID=2248750 RepID=A0A366LKS0_9ACTN|nr:hypothetical protein DP939_42915 [Spongiactinospora rosea]